MEFPLLDHPFQRHFGARHERFHQQEIRGFPAPLFQLGVVEHGGDAPEGRDESRRMVRANHAPAGVEKQRLEHAGIGRLPGCRLRIGGEGISPVPGRAQPGRFHHLAENRLVGPGHNAFLGVGGQAQPGATPRRQHRRAVVHRDHGLQGRVAMKPLDALHGGFQVEKVQRQGASLGEGLQGIGPVQAHHDLMAQLARGGHEIDGPVGLRAHQQENAAHDLLFSGV